VIGRGRRIPLRQIMASLSHPPAEATVRDDLYHLKRLGLIDSTGRGRGATWFLLPGETE
jgi:ATP-dependent DNA helicase RecG